MTASRPGRIAGCPVVVKGHPAHPGTSELVGRAIQEAVAACNLPEWPAWTLEPPTGDTPLVEIDRRSGWLDTVMAPFTDAGCEAGRKATNDEMFCSVE